MKKILLFAILACFLSNCDKKEEQPKILKFSPPLWIHGTWLLKNNPTPGEVGYKFTQDDFCMILGGVACHKDMVKRGQVEILSQKSSGDTYEITLKNSSRRFTAKFKKKSATEIEQVGHGFTRTFVKQKKILKFSPPSWIHGTWLLKNNPTPNKVGYKFTRDDFCVILDKATACHKNVVKIRGMEILSQKSSSTIYEITLKSDLSTRTHKFKKKSATEIQKADRRNSYTSTLVKQ